MTNFSAVGKSLIRVDALEKATGEAVYCADIKLPGLVHAKVLRSPYPHARIVSVNTTEAKRVPGVVCVLSGQDVPKKKFGQVIYDEDILAIDVVRCVGAPVAAVAAETTEAAEEAVKRIKVEYKELPALFNPEEAMSTDPSIVIHPDLANYACSVPFLRRLDPERPNVFAHFKIRTGNIEKGFKEADLVTENKFSTAKMQHCAIEPHVVIARAEPDGGLTVWLSNQCAQARRAELSRLFDIEPSRVRVIQPYIGGAFGAKAVLREEPIAVLLAFRAAGRPVKLEYTREEVFLRGGSRPAITISIKDGVKKDGTIVARKMKAILSAGPTEAAIVLVTRNSAFGAVGTYRLPNFEWDSYGVYLNEPIATSLRGFGNAEVIWAVESQMDILAEKLGIDPVTIRERNILKEGEKNATGEITHSIGVEDCLHKVISAIDINDKQGAKDGIWRMGRGISIGNKYSLAPSASSARVKVMEDGSLMVYHGSSELGQGCDTVMAQIAAEEFSIPVNQIRIAFSDSLYIPYDFGTISSRVTYHMGNAVRMACQDAKQKLFERAARKLGVSIEQLDLKEGMIYVKDQPDRKVLVVELFAGYIPGGYGSYTEGGEIIGNATFIQQFVPENPETGQIPPDLAEKGMRLNAFYGHTAKAVEVAVNIETGEVRLIKCAVADDMGQPINPKMCEQQAEGGIGMGIGAALYEEIIVNQGRIVNPNFTDYRIPSVGQIPKLKDIHTTIAPAIHKDGPYGAKGFAEGVMIGVDAAIANAIYNAVGVRIRDLPISAEKVLKELKEKEGKIWGS